MSVDLPGQWECFRSSSTSPPSSTVRSFDSTSIAPLALAPSPHPPGAVHTTTRRGHGVLKPAKDPSTHTIPPVPPEGAPEQHPPAPQQHVRDARPPDEPPPAPDVHLLALRPHLPRVRPHRLRVRDPALPRGPGALRRRPGRARSLARAAAEDGRGGEETEEVDRGDETRAESAVPAAAVVERATIINVVMHRASLVWMRVRPGTGDGFTYGATGGSPYDRT